MGTWLEAKVFFLSTFAFKTFSLHIVYQTFRFFFLKKLTLRAHHLDGYTSLLIQEEGGTATDLVSEENGVLISTILRQYFMSVKVLGRWKMWGPSLGRHWGTVHQELQQVHPILEPQAPNTKAVEAFRAAAAKGSAKGGHARSHHGGGRMTPGGMRPEGAETPLNESESEFEEEGAVGARSDVKPVPTAVSQRERELVIMRKVMRKWWRLAGLPGHPNLCDELGEGEFMVNWTKVSAVFQSPQCSIQRNVIITNSSAGYRP